MCILAKYEPACNTGMYKWDYKIDREYSALSQLNRYLIELENLQEFIQKYSNHFYYVIAPLNGGTNVQRKRKEMEFLKNNWSKIEFLKIQEEQKGQFEPLEDRITRFYEKKLTQISDFNFIEEHYWYWGSLNILVTSHELNKDEVNDTFSQISSFDFSNSFFDYLILNKIGLINLEMSFFHEEHSHLGTRNGKGEEILMYYCPWKVSETLTLTDH